MLDFSTPGNLWVIDSAFDPIADFCIWTLESDGLHAPPFDQHSQGNVALQAGGLDAELWLLWINKAVLLSNQRIYWSKQNRRFDAQDEAYIRFSNWQDWHHQQAVTAARKICGNELPELPVFPPTLFPIASMKELLEEMWMHYRSNIFHSREQKWSSHPMSRLLTSRLEETMNSYYSDGRLAALDLRFVAYPKSIEYLIPPASIIVSLTEGRSNDNLVPRVLAALEILAS